MRLGWSNCVPSLTLHSSETPWLIFMKLEMYNYFPDRTPHAEFQGAISTWVVWANSQFDAWKFLWHPDYNMTSSTELMWCAAARRQQCLATIGPLTGSSTVTSEVSDLGIYIDSGMRRTTSDGPFRGDSVFYVSCVPYLSRYQLQCPVAYCCTCFFFPDSITATASCFQNSTVRTHSLDARTRTYLLQTGSYDVSIHPLHFSVLPTVVFHPSFWHDIQTTVAVFFLISSGSSARSSLYSRQVGVSGFWCHRLEWPVSPRRICAVTRGFQTTTLDLSVFSFSPKHYHILVFY